MSESKAKGALRHLHVAVVLGNLFVLVLAQAEENEEKWLVETIFAAMLN